MQELETHISIAGPEKKGGLYMTQIILKMAELKEGTQGIADKKASGEKVVSESAIGRAFARTIRRSGLKTPSSRLIKRDFASHSLSQIISSVIGYFCESALYMFSAQR